MKLLPRGSKFTTKAEEYWSASVWHPKQDLQEAYNLWIRLSKKGKQLYMKQLLPNIYKLIQGLKKEQ